MLFTGTHTAQEPVSLFRCDAVMSLQFAPSADSNVTKFASALFYCCVTTRWQWIFKGSLQVTKSMRFSAFDCRPQTPLTGDAAIHWLSGVAGPNFFLAKMFDFRRATVFSLGHRLSKRRL